MKGRIRMKSLRLKLRLRLDEMFFLGLMDGLEDDYGQVYANTYSYEFKSIKKDLLEYCIKNNNCELKMITFCLADKYHIPYTKESINKNMLNEFVNYINYLSGLYAMYKDVSNFYENVSEEVFYEDVLEKGYTLEDIENIYNYQERYHVLSVCSNYGVI